MCNKIYRMPSSISTSLTRYYRNDHYSISLCNDDWWHPLILMSLYTFTADRRLGKPQKWHNSMSNLNRITAVRLFIIQIFKILAAKRPSVKHFHEFQFNIYNFYSSLFDGISSIPIVIIIETHSISIKCLWINSIYCILCVWAFPFLYFLRQTIANFTFFLLIF